MKEHRIAAVIALTVGLFLSYVADSEEERLKERYNTLCKLQTGSSQHYIEKGRTWCTGEKGSSYRASESFYQPDNSYNRYKKALATKGGISNDASK